MSTRTPGGIRASGESCLRELGRARHLALTGRPAPSARAIRERFDYELGREALDVALQLAIDAERGTDEESGGRVLLGWLAELEIDRALAPLADLVERWRGETVVRSTAGLAVPFDEVKHTIGREPSREVRTALEQARTALIERELLSTLVERDVRWRDVVGSLDVADSVPEAVERISGTELDRLADRARAALARSADAWRETLAHALRRRSSVTIGAATFPDLLRAVGPDEIDGAFPGPRRLDVARRAVRALGLGGDLEGRLTIESGVATDARERAEHVALESPGNVRVVIGSAGGLRAYDVALEETGRALHLAHTVPDAPFELRYLGDPGTRAMCGRIVASLLLDRKWLEHELELSRSEAATVARASAFVGMYDLRRACGAALYRIQWLAAELAYGAAQELYVATMTDALGVAPPPIDALFEAPPTLTPGSRMRAFEATGTVLAALVERFDEDWYRNPRTGPWVAEQLFAAARGRLAADVVARATGHEASLTRYIERLETELAS